MSETAPAYRPMLRFLEEQDRSVVWLMLAIVCLPIDGTTFGLYAPFWSPISPAFFAVYCACNWRALRIVARRYVPFFLLPVALTAISIPGWIAFGVHGWAAFMSITGFLGALATLASLAIAFDIRRIDWYQPLRALITSYWFAFGVGAVQWLTVQLKITPLVDYFEHLMRRQYITTDSQWGGGRPQFLFAEPSYIGMHLFGVLLPLFWLVRRRDRAFAARLRDLIIVFSVGAVAMQAGTRIILDILVALVIVIVLETKWRDAAQRMRGMLALIGTALLGAISFALNQRLSSIAENGASGDGSFFARLYQSLDPLCGLIRHWWTLLFGYGASGIADAAKTGAAQAADLLDAWGLDGKAAQGFADGQKADTIWTMSAYTSFITEYGFIGFALLIVALIWRIRRVIATGITTNNPLHNDATLKSTMPVNKLLICWLFIIAYLYVQCENYAFAAIPLLIWGMAHTSRWMHTAS